MRPLKIVQCFPWGWWEQFPRVPGDEGGVVNCPPGRIRCHLGVYNQGTSRTEHHGRSKAATAAADKLQKVSLLLFLLPKIPSKTSLLHVFWTTPTCLISQSAVWSLLGWSRKVVPVFSNEIWVLFSSDGLHSENVDRVCSSRHLSAGMLEQLRRRVSPQTGEPGEQRVPGGLGQIPGCCQALCQPHHQAEVSETNRS